jgi:hypothetical protein
VANLVLGSQRHDLGQVGVVAPVGMLHLGKLDIEPVCHLTAGTVIGVPLAHSY